jgi:voltage-gated potassium channel
MSALRRVLWGAFWLVIIVVIGVIGYELIEGWKFLDSLYMVMITITTVGYNEVHPLSSAGRIFTMFLMFGGVGGALYALSGIVGYVVEGNIGTEWELRKMKNRINALKDHFILCGFGRVGEEIAKTFKAEDVPFIVIDNRPDRLEQLSKSDYIYLAGDATRDEILKEAGIESARGLIAAVGTDVDNTYITLSARGICPGLFIEARASSPEAAKKLERSGANRVIMPHAIGGSRMAMLALRPAVVDFVDNVIYSRGREMLLESIDVKADSNLVGQTIQDINHRTRVVILAMQKKGVSLMPNPSGDVLVEKGDQLFVIGTRAQLTTLEQAL